MMRITEAGLRKIVREMLKEASAGVEDEFDTNTAEYEAQLAAKAKGVQADNAKNIVSNLRNQLTLVAAPTAAPRPAPQTPPTAAPAAKQPRGNPTVMQVQKIIGAPQDGFWGQQTQTKFINFVQSKINEGILLLSVDRGRQIGANELSNWKNIAEQIGYVGNILVQKKFAPNINGLFNFLTFLKNATAPMTNPLAAPVARLRTMEDELENQYLDWGQPGSTTKAYFNKPK